MNLLAIIATSIFFLELGTPISIIAHLSVIIYWALKLHSVLIKEKGNIKIHPVQFLFLLLLSYIVINSQINCCSVENFKRTVRLASGVTLFFMFSNINWKRIAMPITFTYSLLHVVSLLITGIGLISKELWMSIWNYLLQEERAKFFLFEITRGRYVQIGQLYLTAALPTSFLLMKKNSSKFFGAISLISASVAILFWGYRSYAISFFTGIFLSMLLTYKHMESINQKPTKGIITTGMVALTIISSFVLYLILSKLFLEANIVDRFLLRYPIDKQSLQTRAIYDKDAVTLFLTSPLLGVGVGNYRNFSVSILSQFRTATGIIVSKKGYVYRPEPHNIFTEYLSETGIIGIALWAAILIVLIRSDLSWIVLKKKRHSYQNDLYSFTGKLFMIASWTFIISGFLNTYSKEGFYTYFILRGIAESARINEVGQETKL